ncbi:MAG: long-chain fatty acid--CoA ligase [Acidobacteriota bacterium]
MQTLRELFDHGCAQPQAEHLRSRAPDGTWSTSSTEELCAAVDALAACLQAHGLVAGDRVALLSRNCASWAMADWALVTRGLVNVPLYPTSTDAQVEHVLEDSGCRAFFIEDGEQLARLAPTIEASPVELVILLQAGGELVSPEGVTLLTWDEAVATLPGDDYPAPGPDTLASLIYTSGTTGQPKGVMLSHHNLVSNALACSEAIDLSRVAQVNLSLLPLCHVFQRLVDYFLFHGRAQMVYCHDPLLALELFAKVRPTFFASVPRLYEKVRAGILAKLATAPGLRRKLAEWALDVGRRHFHAWYRDGACDGSPGLGLSWSHALADRLVLQKLRAPFGGRVDLCFSGGAALPPEVHEFYRAIGLELLPGYGLTEASPVLCTNRNGVMKLGSVGPSLPGLELKLAEDGELLSRGPNTMQGYWRNDEATAATVIDGWLHTGDRARIDERGFVFITGRKKEILVLSTGKNVSPQVVEDQIGRSSLVAQAVVVGDDCKYIGVLVHPNLTTLAERARAEGLSFSDESELLTHEKVPELLLADLESCCADLAPYERPKRLAILPRELSMAEGELTPTLKLRRAAISESWAELIETLYPEGRR